MMNAPDIVDRPETPYVAKEVKLSLPMDDLLSAHIGEVFRFFSENGIVEAGPLFFKYNVVEMPLVEMEIGVPTDHRLDPPAPFISGLVPSGKYAQVTYFGPYENLMSVNGDLINWARRSGLALDSRPSPAGERFASRLEIYHNSPAEESDPQKLETTVAIKLAVQDL